MFKISVNNQYIYFTGIRTAINDEISPLRGLVKIVSMVETLVLELYGYPFQPM